MNDRELLELAAKAAGIAYRYQPGSHKFLIEAPCTMTDGTYYTYWNPLTDDGDALRLAVKLDISVFFRPNFVHAEIATSAHEGLVLQEPPTPDKNAATRRAIVRAAAQIGEHMEKQNGN